MGYQFLIFRKGQNKFVCDFTIGYKCKVERVFKTA